ncbi:MAG: arginine deiminase family protein [Bdellovibrionota bacterium]
MSLVALVRPPSAKLANCELTYLDRNAISIENAIDQHRQYVRALETAGCAVRALPGSEEFADGVFVEDAAVVLDELAIITRPGAESRQAEVASVVDALTTHRKQIARISAPATMDGGDVLVVEKTIFVGLSTRTNDEGFRQMKALASPFGYVVHAIEVRGCLHLKTGFCHLGGDTYLINPAWVDGERVQETSSTRMNFISVDESEPFGANVLRVGDTLLYPLEHPKTAAKLEAGGFFVTSVPISELAKAEAGLTCMSVVFRE